MSKKKDGAVPSALAEKYQKIIDKLPEFKDTADSASIEDLKKMVVTFEGNIYTIEQEKKDDTKLNAAKELSKEYSVPYNEALKVQTAKVKYALYLLENKGVDLDNKE